MGSLPFAISATKSFSPVVALTDITVPSKFTANIVLPPPMTMGEDMKYGGSSLVCEPDATSLDSAVVPTLVTETFQSNLVHPGEHLYRNPSCPAYTSEPSGRSAGEEETGVPVTRHPRGSPVWISRVSIRLSCVPMYTTPFVSSSTGVACSTYAAKNRQTFVPPGEILYTANSPSTSALAPRVHSGSYEDVTKTLPKLSTAGAATMALPG